jgi:hypothetical protein
MQGLRSLIDKANAATERRAAETFRFMEEQKIRKTLAPSEWETFKGQLIQECASLAQSTEHRIQSETRGANELILKHLATNNTAKFAYNADMPCVFFEGYDGGGHFAFRPSADGMTLQWFDTKRNAPTSINDLVFEIAAYLIH